MSGTVRKPSAQPPALRVPRWLRVAQVGAGILAAAFVAGAAYQLLMAATGIAGAWATMGVGCAGVWIGLLQYGLQLRRETTGARSS